MPSIVVLQARAVHRLRTTFYLAALALAWACDAPAAPVEQQASTVQQWIDAQALWRRGDVTAYAAWQAIEPLSSEGREARVRLERADGFYRSGVARLEGDGQGAREALTQGVGLAPIDPRLYVRLGRACRTRGLEHRAIEYFTKYLTAYPDSAESASVRAELEELEPELAGVFDPIDPGTFARSEQVDGQSELRLLGLGALLGLLLAMFVSTAVRFLRHRGVSLARLAEDRPELHPAIAYLVGSLRHELLKHRVGAAGDALSALAAGDQGQEQLEFLRSRLFGGQPLREAWQGYVDAFERALGGLELRRDADFRMAERQIRRIAALESELAQRDPRAVKSLAAAHDHLTAFDAQLARLVSGLVRTRVDDDLLAEILAEVQSEYAVSQVDLDEMLVDIVEEPADVEVFRVDLVLVIKNILRNAILATGRSESPRRVGLDVSLELEPTGEETVRLRVSDTSPEELRPEMLLDRRVDQGLGLVAAAVTRYGGSIEIEPGSRGFQKGVVVSFFRTLDEVD